MPMRRRMGDHPPPHAQSCRDLLIPRALAAMELAPM